MNYVKSSNMFGVDTKEIPCITGEGVPTTETEGAVGCLYMNTLTGEIYKCTAIADGAYTWVSNANDDKNGVSNAVLYVPQELTEEQKAQARENIGLGEGSDILYVGEKITLQKHGMNYSQLFNCGGMGTHSQQDGCVFNNYYFQFASDGYFGVYNLSTLALIGVFPLDQVETITPHCNSACFSGIYYDDGDEFPLLFVNAYNNAGLPLGTCYVHRILRNDNTFSTVLLKMITVGFTDDEMWVSTDNEFRPYGNFVVDTDNNHLYAYTLRDADKTTRFFQFAMPSFGSYSEGAYDHTKAANNTAIRDAGEIIDSDSFWLTDYLKLDESGTLTSNYAMYKVAYYDAEKTFIRTALGGTTINTVQSVYVRVQFNNAVVAYDAANTVSFTGIASGKEITLSKSDVLNHFDVKHFPVIQGCAYFNSKLFVTSGFGSRDASGCWLHVIDLMTQKEVSTIDFKTTITGEPEAIDVFDGKIIYGAGGSVYELTP